MGDDQEPVAWGPVLATAGAVVAVLLALAGRYGWHRDELYFLEAGQHLAWGFVDQPPFTPAVARLAHEVAPGSLLALRALPALATGATIVLGALLARELGARRGGQVAAAAAVAVGGFLLGAGHLLATAAFDLTAWMALLCIATRILRRGDPRWWVAFGTVAGLSMLNKNLLVLLGVALAAGLVVERRWPVLRSPWLAAGAVISVALAMPNLGWQAAHGWPQVEMARVLSERLAGENRATLLPMQVLFAGPALVGVGWRGVCWLRRAPEARPFRPLLWAWPAGLATAFVTAGRPYYVLPLTLTIVIAGVVATERAGGTRRLAPLLVANGAISALLALPLLPLSTVSTTATLNEAVAETVGWPELADQVRKVLDGLPAAEREGVVLLTASYGEAGALDRFGPSRGLPEVFSPHNGYADFRRPRDDEATVVSIRFPVERLAPHFDRCEQVARVDNGLDVPNEVQGTPILVCRGLRGTWSTVWEELRLLS